MNETESYNLTCPRCDRRTAVEAQCIDTDVDSMAHYVGTTLCDGCYTRLNVKDYREEGTTVGTRPSPSAY